MRKETINKIKTSISVLVMSTMLLSNAGVGYATTNTVENLNDVSYQETVNRNSVKLLKATIVDEHANTLEIGTVDDNGTGNFEVGTKMPAILKLTFSIDNSEDSAINVRSNDEKICSLQSDKDLNAKTGEYRTNVDVGVDENGECTVYVILKKAGSFSLTISKNTETIGEILVSAKTVSDTVHKNEIPTEKAIADSESETNNVVTLSVNNAIEDKEKEPEQEKEGAAAETNQIIDEPTEEPDAKDEEKNPENTVTEPDESVVEPTEILGTTEDNPEEPITEPEQSEVTGTEDGKTDDENCGPTTPEMSDKLTEAKEKLDAAEKKFDEALEKYEEAKKIFEEAESAVTMKENTLIELREKKAEAEAELAAAQQARNESLEHYEYALNNITESEEYKELINKAAEQSKVVEMAVQIAATAKDELTSSKEEYIEAAANAEQAKAELDNTQDELDAAKEELEIKEKQLEEAKRATEIAAENDTKAKEEYENILADVEAAKLKLTETKEKYDEALESLNSVSTEAEIALDKYNEAVKEYESAQAVVAQGSLGFFVSHATPKDMFNEDTTIAERVLEVAGNEAGADFKTNVGALGDATSLDSMKHALELIPIGNELRTTDDNFPGLKDLYVNDGLMMMAQVQVNQEKLAVEHWTDNIAAQWKDGRMNNGENAAWGYKNPFDGWYTAEKEIYDNNLDGVTGHYTNIVEQRFEITGMGTNGYASVQDFAGGYGSNRWGEAYTFEEYYETFMDYYDTVMGAVEDAKTNADAAYQEYQETLNSAEKEQICQEAKDAYETAESELEKLNTEAEGAEVAVIEAETELENAKSSENQAQIEAEEATAQVGKIEIKISNLEENYESACEIAAATLENVNSAEEKASVAETTAAEEQNKLEAINNTVENLIENKETAEVLEAKENLEIAEKELANAQNNVEAAETAVTETEAEVEFEKSNLDELKEAESLAEAEYNTAADDVRQAENEVQIMLKDAE